MIDPDAEDLRHQVQDVVRALHEGDGKKVGKKLEELERKLDALIGAGKIVPAAADGSARRSPSTAISGRPVPDERGDPQGQSHNTAASTAYPSSPRIRSASWHKLAAVHLGTVPGRAGRDDETSLGWHAATRLAAPSRRGSMTH